MDTPPELHAVLTGSQRHAILQTDAYDGLALLPPASVDLLLTSPPYWGLRDYEMEHNLSLIHI